MLCLYLKNTDPFFCLATEEYLLKNFSDDIFMLWQSDNTVVVGKHQNLLAEVNYPFVMDKNVILARRISGGGTVFHDIGNVNFTFIKNVKSPAEISFKQFTQPVVEALAKLGIEAGTSGRNDLLINGLKISGNAEHVFKNRVLHHGTLLFRSDLQNLGESIRVREGKYTGKAVQSNRSEVTNIASHLTNDLSTAEFIQFLLDVQLDKSGNKPFSLSDTDVFKVGKLADEKFKSWEWIYGYSPKYHFDNEYHKQGKRLLVSLDVKKGMIENCTLEGDYFSTAELNRYSGTLEHQKHDWRTIQEIFRGEDIEFIKAFF